MLIVPAIQQRYSDTFSSDALKAAKSIKANYGSILSAASLDTGVDVNVIVGFMIVENTPADPTAVSYGCSSTAAADYGCAYGLMQMQVATAFQTIKDQAAAGMEQAEISIVQKYLPGFLKPAGFVGFLASWKKQIRDALFIPEFSIWVGAMHLAQLIANNIKKYSDPRLDHIIIQYNTGVGNYNKEVVKAGLDKVDTATLALQLPVAETRAYLVKFLGIDGSVLAAMRS